MKPITGSIVALITPMHEDGSVDYDTLRALMDWHIAEGTDCIGVVGTTGESPTVSVDEHFEIIRVAVEHCAGRVPVMAGTGGNTTREAIELSELLRMQARLLHELPQQLTPAHRDFLLSLVRGDPAWELMPMPHLRELPAIDWKLENLAKLKQVSADRFATQHQLLVRRFDSASDPLNNE